METWAIPLACVVEDGFDLKPLAVLLGSGDVPPGELNGRLMGFAMASTDGGLPSLDIKAIRLRLCNATRS